MKENETKQPMAFSDLSPHRAWRQRAVQDQAWPRLLTEIGRNATMFDYKLPATALGIFLLATSISLMGGCEKKEEAPMPQTAGDAAPEAQPTVPPSPVTPPAPEATGPTEKAAGDAGPAVADGEAAMKKSDCFACHTVDTKLVGPPYSWIAFRYKDDKEAVTKLAASVKNGSTGKWTAYTGGVPMTPHPQLPDDEIKAMVEWILGRKPVEPPKG